MKVSLSKLPRRLRAYIILLTLLLDGMVAAVSALGMYAISRLAAKGMEIIATLVPIKDSTEDFMFKALLIAGDVTSGLSFVSVLLFLGYITLKDVAVELKVDLEDEG